ncbi:MAG: hypothetical protein ACI3W7_08290 [Oscillospiraceae bacterium]
MKKHLCLIMALCMIFSMAFLGSSAFAANETEYSEDIVKAAQRALDRVEVENVISKHEYYHSALNHMEEFLDIWVNEDPWMETMSWTNNNQKMVGAYNVWGFMVPDLVSNISNSLGSAMNNDDQGIIEESDEWYGTGMFWYHMLMSPMIVVADDGQTARACFQSFGTVTGPMGDLCAQWTCESYGFDCAKMSTGEWRIWHLHTYVYFYVDTTGTWAYTNSSSSEPAGVDAALLPTGAALTNAGGAASGDMTPPDGDMTPPSGEPSGGGGMVQGDYEVISGQYFTNFSIYKTPESCPMPYPYDTWATVEANGDGY